MTIIEQQIILSIVMLVLCLIGHAMITIGTIKKIKEYTNDYKRFKLVANVLGFCVLELIVVYLSLGHAVLLNGLLNVVQ